MNNNELIKKLYAISVLSERLAKTDKKYERLARTSEEIAELISCGMSDDEIVAKLLIEK